MELMNENRKMEMLNQVLPEGEIFRATVWGTIMGGSALTNQYCYVGLTDSTLCFANIDSINPSIMTGGFALPIYQIDSSKVKKGLLGRTVITIKSSGATLKLSLASNTFGSKLSKEGQIAGIEYFASHLNKG